jgi:hypothetical protein
LTAAAAAAAAAGSHLIVLSITDASNAAKLEDRAAAEELPESKQ